MILQPLDSGRFSLEFARSEFGAIKARLKKFGDVAHRQETTFDTVLVNGSELILLDEWDAPCLISTDTAGDRVLKQIVAAEDRLRKADRQPLSRDAA